MERASPFLPAAPEILIETKQFNHVPYTLGLTENEGAIVAASEYLDVMLTIFM